VNLFIYYDWSLFFLYEPLLRVLSASGVITRFKKKIIHEAAIQKNTPIAQLSYSKNDG